MFESKTAEGKRKISQALLPVIQRLQNKIEQSARLKELAMKLQVSEESVEQELKKYFSLGKTQKASSKETTEESVILKSPKTRRKVIEEKIISLILNYPEGLKLVKKDSFDLFSSTTKEIIKIFQDNPEELSKDFKNLRLSEERWELISGLALKGAVENEESDEEIDIENEILICFQELRYFSIKEKLAEFSQKIKRAQKEGLKEDIDDLSEKFNQLIEKLAEINNQ
jgi:DNA primase